MLRAKNYLVQATLRRNGVYAAARSALTSMTVSDLSCGFTAETVGLADARLRRADPTASPLRLYLSQAVQRL